MNAPLIQFPIDLSRLVGVMQDIHDVLVGVRAALERLAPAPLQPLDPPRPAGLSDLRRTDPDSVSRIKSELTVFANNNNVKLDSDAFMQSIINYEREVGATYGEEAISELPWNKAAGGPLFKSYIDNQSRKTVEGKESR